MAKKKYCKNSKVRERTVPSTFNVNKYEASYMFVVIIINVLLSVISDNSVLFVKAEEDYMTSEELDYTYQTGDRTTVDIVEGQNASLPCSVPVPADDTPALTLWYVGTDQTPIYSYDQRGNSKKGSGWADPLLFGDQRFPTGVRVKFDIHQDPPSLIIFDVRQQDSREYRCRVDFSKSTSEFAWAILKVVVPPKRINLLTQITVVSPGDTNDVICQVSGGIPPASVLWIQKGQVVDANYNVTAGVSYNSLEKVADRSDLENPFTCTAHNNDITSPLTTTYLRNVTCGPLSMKVVSHPKVLSAGRPGDLMCKVIGSNPSPIIKWFRRGKIFDAGNITTVHESNMTTSTLTFIPTREDHNSQAVCRAENELLPLATLEDIVTLEVTYGPEIELRIGWPVSQTDALKEGSDVFLECSLDSNPKVYKISWFKDSVLLTDNEPSKSAVSDTTLALNKINRHMSGRYQCFASNVEGDTYSNNVTIRVEYAPVCTHGPLLLGVSLNVLTNVTCRVEAEPHPESFSWTFDRSNKRDGSSAQRKTSERSSKRDWKYISSGSESTLFYTARSSTDYGILKCFAHNNIDRQRRPCIIKIVPAGEDKLTEENKYEHYKPSEEKHLEKIPATTEAVVRTRPTTTVEKTTQTPTTEIPFLKPTEEKPAHKIAEDKKHYKITEEKKKHNLPLEVGNCIVLNVTTHTAGVTCQPGGNGGQGEQYLVQVYRDDAQEVVFNETLTNCAFFTVTNLLPSYLYSATVTAFNQHGQAKPRKFSLRTGRLTRVEKSLPSQTSSTSIAWATGGTIGGVLLIIILILGVRWFIKQPPSDSLSKLSIRTLSKKDSTKEKGNLLKGASSNPEESTMNGVFEYTIYDSSGRYRGFSHLPPQMPGGRYPVPVASGGTCEDPTTSASTQSNCCEKNDYKDLDKIDNVALNNTNAGYNSNNVKLKTSRGWAKLRGALVFIRKSNYKLDFKRIVHPRHSPDNKDQESKI